MVVWLPIENFPNYEVSGAGKVRNRNTGRILSHCDVHRKDLKKCNNCVHNLEFLSKIEHRGRHERSVRIIETGEVFDSAHACARYIHGNHSSISECLRGNPSYKTHKGFSFEYYEGQ